MLKRIHRNKRFIVLLLLLVCFIKFEYTNKHFLENDLINEIHQRGFKAVQLLTKEFLNKTWSETELGERPFTECAEKRCFAFKPFRFMNFALEKSDAVLIHLPKLISANWRNNYKRNPKQTLSNYKIWIADQASLSENTFWFVSNCKTRSRRENYINGLVDYTKVDIYSNCENLKSSKPDPCKHEKISQEYCYLKIYSSYKFYIAFENTQCSFYITEKYWKLYTPEYLFAVNVIPVVRGARSEDYDQTAYAKGTKKSYINADDYKPESLAEYLNYLNNNQTAFLEYFEWKLELAKEFQNEQVVQTEKDAKPSTQVLLCDICARLHNETYMNSQTNEIIRPSEWFNPKDECWDQEYPNFFAHLFAKFFGTCV